MKLQGIEAARGIAALLVVLRHATMIMSDAGSGGALPLGGLFMFGRAGVEFFFVLSGFIIFYIHHDDLGRSPAFATFWRKRLLRIYPPYWAATIALGVILVFSPTRDRAEQEFMHILSSFLLLPEIHTPILDVGWSLRHEMLFYVIFSLAILHRPTGVLVMVCWFAGILASLLSQVFVGVTLFGGEAGDLVFRGFNVEFFAGMAVAVLVRRFTFKPLIVLSAGVSLFVGNGLYESFGPEASEWPPRILLYALSSAMVIYGIAILDRGRSWTMPRAALVLGDASYSVYLTHVTILIVVAQVFRKVGAYVIVPGALSFMVALATAVVGGICFSLVVERPIVRLGKRHARTA